MADVPKDREAPNHPPPGSVRIDHETVRCMHEEPHVLWEKFGRGPGSTERGRLPPTGTEYEALVKPYRLVLKRHARGKWIGFTSDELKEMTEETFMQLIHKYFFGGIPASSLKLSLTSQRAPWNLILGPVDCAEDRWLMEQLLKRDQREYIVFRYHESIKIRDGRDITRYQNWSTLKMQMGLDIVETSLFEGRAPKPTGEPNFMALLKQLFPAERDAGIDLMIQVDRYKVEWITIPGSWTREQFMLADPQNRYWRQKISLEVLWMIDDPVINIYPRGWNPKLTYEQWETKLQAWKHSRETAGAQAPPIIQSAAEFIPAPAGAPALATVTMRQPIFTQPTTLSSVPPAPADTTGTRLNAQTDARKTAEESSRNICKQHPSCATLLDDLTEIEKVEHMRMHETNQCHRRNDCHAHLSFMAVEECHQDHIMHDLMIGQRLEHEGPVNPPIPTAHCPEHQWCHARVASLSAPTDALHRKMHKDGRCNAPKCCAPLSLMTPREQREHREMHNTLPLPKKVEKLEWGGAKRDKVHGKLPAYKPFSFGEVATSSSEDIANASKAALLFSDLSDREEDDNTYDGLDVEDMFELLQKARKNNLLDAVIAKFMRIYEEKTRQVEELSLMSLAAQSPYGGAGPNNTAQEPLPGRGRAPKPSPQLAAPRTPHEKTLNLLDQDSDEATIPASFTYTASPWPREVSKASLNKCTTQTSLGGVSEVVNEKKLRSDKENGVTQKATTTMVATATRTRKRKYGRGKTGGETIKDEWEEGAADDDEKPAKKRAPPKTKPKKTKKSKDEAFIDEAEDRENAKAKGIQKPKRKGRATRSKKREKDLYTREDFKRDEQEEKDEDENEDGNDDASQLMRTRPKTGKRSASKKASTKTVRKHNGKVPDEDATTTKDGETGDDQDNKPKSLRHCPVCSKRIYCLGATREATHLEKCGVQKKDFVYQEITKLGSKRQGDNDGGGKMAKKSKR